MATKNTSPGRTRMTPLSELTPHPANARQGDVGAIIESLKDHGQYRPIVAQVSTGRILAGNHTYQAARQLGWAQMSVTWVDVDDDQALRILLVDNRTNDLASYDDAGLAVILENLVATERGLSGTGFAEEDLEDLLRSLEPDKSGHLDPERLDDVPNVTTPVTKPGDVWVLGEHRVMCGDATDPEAVAKVMAGAMATCMWTDPPYGVEYVGKTKDQLTIQGDTEAGLRHLLESAFRVAGTALEPGSPWYCAHPAGARSLVFGDAIRAVGWSIHETLVWVKNTMVLGHADYHYRHEPIFYGWLPGPGRSGRGKHEGSRWYGDHAQTSVLEYDKPSRSESHPTMKPVGLVAQCIGNSSRPGETVLDPFGGSGSTLIACEQTGRRCRMMEIDPGYVDVIVARYQSLTGVKPILEATGKAHDFLTYTA